MDGSLKQYIFSDVVIVWFVIGDWLFLSVPGGKKVHFSSTLYLVKAITVIKATFQKNFI